MSFGTSFALTTRPVTMGRTCAMVTGHHLATQAGMQIMHDGGNAMDAAITAAAALAVLKPDACGLGSDLFLVYREARSGVVTALNASGPAPLLATPTAFPDGIAQLGLRASAVPGAVHAWEAALERYGTLPLASALAPAIDLARNGMPVSALFASTLETNRAMLAPFAETMRVFYRAGRAPRAGELLVQSDLADSLDEIARDGARAFYTGTFARAIDAYARRCGAFIRFGDLAGYASAWSPALRATYRGAELYGQPPVSVGIAVLEAMQILAAFDIASIDPDSADFIHLHVEALKLALADMRGSIGDPGFAPDAAVALLLDPAHAAQRARSIDMLRAGAPPDTNVAAATGTDTSYVSAVDADGNSVSLLQSVFSIFGSGEIVPGTGALMNNRMTGFSLDPRSPNALAPGKRALNTLNPLIVRTAGGELLTLGTPGGPCQTYTNVNLLLRVLDHDADLQRAIDAPRWFLNAANVLQIEESVAAGTRSQLIERGHVLAPVPRHSAALGGAGMVRINAGGVREAAADPRRESYALAH